MLKIIKQHTLINFTNTKIVPKYIVHHDTGVLGQTAKNNADYFYNVYRSASAAYFVWRKTCYEVVDPTKVEWHVGDDKPGDRHDVGDLINNYNSIGIELCFEKDGTLHPDTLETARLLTQKLMKDFNIPASKNVRHYDASGKNCPQFLNKDGKWTDWYKYHKHVTGSSSGSVVVGNPSSAKLDSYTVKSGDSLWGISKQYNVSIAQLKSINALKTDTIHPGQVLKLKATPKHAPKPVAQPKQPAVKVYKESATFYPNTMIYVRDNPSTTSGNIVTTYNAGESVTYHTVHMKNGYVWLEYARSSGGKGYIPCREYNANGLGTLWGTIGSTPAPKAKKTYVKLASHVSRWRVYPLNARPIAGNEVGFLNPAAYGGLTYELLEYRDGKTTAVIQTDMFGKVKLFLDHDATIYTA